MNLSQPGLFHRVNGRLLEYARRHRDLTACALLVLAYLVVCALLQLPYYYIGLLVVGIIILGISLKYPFVAYLSYVFIIHFLPYVFFVSKTFTLPKVGGVFLLAVTIAATAIRTPEFGRRFKRAFDKRGIAVLILILGGALSTIVSRNPRSFFTEQHFQFLALFVLTRAYVDTKKRLWWLLVVILLARGMDAALGLYRYVTVPDIGRIGGNFVDPNEYACYTLFTLPIAVYLSHSQQNIIRRIFFVGLGLLAFAAVILSFSRAGFVALGLTILCVFLIPAIKMRNRLIILFITILLVISFIPFDYWTRIETLSSLFENEEMERSVMLRKGQIETSIRLFLENPIFGVGYMKYRTTPERLLGGYVIKRLRIAEHSTFFQVLVEFGLVGFIPFMFLIILTISSGIRAVKLAKLTGDKEYRLLSAATLVSFTSFLIFSLMLGTYTKFLYLYIALPMVVYDLVADKLSRRVAERGVTDEEDLDGSLA